MLLKTTTLVVAGVFLFNTVYADPAPLSPTLRPLAMSEKKQDKPDTPKPRALILLEDLKKEFASSLRRQTDILEEAVLKRRSLPKTSPEDAVGREMWARLEIRRLTGYSRKTFRLLGNVIGPEDQRRFLELIDEKLFNPLAMPHVRALRYTYDREILPAIGRLISQCAPASPLEVAPNRITAIRQDEEISRMCDELHALSHNIIKAYKAAGNKMPEFYQSANPSGEGVYWPSPEWLIASVLKTVGVHHDDTMLEVGCADASVSCLVSRVFGINATGIEVWEPYLHFAAFQRDQLVKEGFLKEGQMTLVNKNFADEDVDFSNYSIIYYAAHGAKRKHELLSKMLTVKKGARIVIHGAREPEIEGALETHPDFSVKTLDLERGGELQHSETQVYTRIADSRPELIQPMAPRSIATGVLRPRATGEDGRLSPPLELS